METVFDFLETSKNHNNPLTMNVPIEKYDYYILTLWEISHHPNKLIALEMLKSCLKDITHVLSTPLGSHLEEAGIYFENLQKIIHHQEPDDVVIMNDELTLESIQQKLELLEQQLESDSLFPGHIVKFYPHIQERHARKKTHCDISGESISIGTIYLYYRPLIHNLTTHRAYVLQRSLTIMPFYQYLLPTDIKSFEQFDNNLNSSYREYGENSSYYDIAANIGNSSLTLQFLQKRKNRQK